MTHIIIVGAGAAGLMAACELAEKKYHVTIVEARDRIGGRIDTLADKFSIPVEAGAEFIHDVKPLTMSLVIESGNKVSLHEGNRFRVWDDEMQEGDPLDEDWRKLMRTLKKLDRDMTMASFLEIHFNKESDAGLREHVKGFVEGYDAADLHRVSAFALRKEWENTNDENQYHISGGYRFLPDYLLSKAVGYGCKLMLSSPVSEIQWSKGNVRVRTSAGSVDGDKVIITVPLGVLQKGTIKFTPALPVHRKSFAQMGFGGIIKFLFEFNIPFWEDCRARAFQDMAFVFSDAPVPTWWTQRPDKAPVLTGWFGGPETFASGQTDEILLDKALRSLEYIFHCPARSIRDQIRHYHIADWTRDPFACGAYAYETVESPQAKTHLATPVADTLHFAGEAIYSGVHMGTVEAALVSGKDVAERLSHSS